MKGFLVAKKWITACDVCDKTAGVVRVVVTMGVGVRGEADLCAEHSAPLRDFVDKNPRRVQRRRVMSVVDPEKIPRKAP